MVDACACLIFASFLGLFASAHAQDLHKGTRALVSNLDDVSVELVDAVRAVRRLKKFLNDEAPSCLVSATDCSMGYIDPIEGFIDVVSNPNSPGKRSVRSVENRTLLQKRYVNDILNKRELIGRMQSTLTDILNVIHNERKRSCKLNLGFHCQTEEYSAIADMYNFLQSAMSPGKR
ncbi:uncharacterized protein LOC110455247 isoform X2 [Mizuhopecten yessoensis]|uniref:Calcitonin 2 n=2 Tax=Mizuhopecten yessoensis TaxID=6573 RepID=A0A210QDE3_MIZYE|nr:uncharacterized protein LOC110455247 isoform X2 [Mizuhopecten yessoensis]AXN93478.1 calcitonin 2 [Mizuhopecten yessoensis]OWF46764.1 hypothetical protein KP79_PYT18876 [Mizuhopecten yessoensis]